MPDMLHGTFLQDINVVSSYAFKQTTSMAQFIEQMGEHRPFVSHMVELYDGFVYCIKDRNDYFEFKHPDEEMSKHKYYNHRDQECEIVGVGKGLVLARYSPYPTFTQDKDYIYFLANPILLLESKLPF